MSLGELSAIGLSGSRSSWQHARRHNPACKNTLFLLVFILPATIAHAGLISEIDRNIESSSMEKLAISKKQTAITPFVTDGCSGGLSASWQFIAGKFPKFASKYGSQPPWQACCVAHDETYWYGETKLGYDKRLLADEELKICVEEKGLELAPTLSEKHNVTEREIEFTFKIAALMMYRVVRIGGKPCTRFPWRWGFGWPQC